MPTGQTKIPLPLPGVEARYVPVFLGPGVAGQQVDHGYFWPITDVDLGTPAVFHWDAIACPNGDGYLISDGYGGSHALLWGWSGGIQTGNVWNGSTNTTFGGGYVINPGEWVFLSVDWDGSSIRCYVNGINDGITAFAGPRHSVSLGNGGGKLYVMGSDHSNAGGKVAFLRGWEQQDIFNGASTNRLIARIPERRPGFEGFDTTNGVVLPCNFYCDYTAPGNTFPDLSPVGYRSRWHPGRLHGIGVGAGAQGALNSRFSPNTLGDQSIPFPTWSRDNNCPLWVPVGAAGATGEVVRTPVAVPANAKVFDSFQRPNQTYAYQEAPTLGSTEGGSLGPLVWQTATTAGRTRAALWGILGGYAVILDQGPAIAYVDTQSATQDIQVTRRRGTFDNGYCGLCFRLVDASNYWVAFINTALNQYTLATVTANAAPVAVQTYTPGSTTWTKMRITTSGTTITAYVDNGAGGWTSLGAITNATFQAGTGAGIGSGIASFATDSLARWANFSCF